MRTHQVEVDDEVFAFVKSHAEPLVDSFNSSLRRFLPLSGAKTAKVGAGARPIAAAKAEILPSFPNGTPQALRQILEVAILSRAGAYARTSATQFIADRHGIAKQTVQDKYARQLGITTHQFDRLIEQSDTKELRHLLKSKFSRHAEIIDKSLN